MAIKCAINEYSVDCLEICDAFSFLVLSYDTMLSYIMTDALCVVMTFLFDELLEI